MKKKIGQYVILNFNIAIKTCNSKTSDNDFLTSVPWEMNVSSEPGMIDQMLNIAADVELDGGVPQGVLPRPRLSPRRPDQTWTSQLLQGQIL